MKSTDTDFNNVFLNHNLMNINVNLNLKHIFTFYSIFKTYIVLVSVSNFESIDFYHIIFLSILLIADL
jgi:hypothetical protein